MTGNFKEFMVENHGGNSWDEQNAMATTAVCSFLFCSVAVALCNYLQNFLLTDFYQFLHLCDMNVDFFL